MKVAQLKLVSLLLLYLLSVTGIQVNKHSCAMQGEQLMPSAHACCCGDTEEMPEDNGCCSTKAVLLRAEGSHFAGRTTVEFKAEKAVKKPGLPHDALQVNTAFKTAWPHAEARATASALSLICRSIPDTGRLSGAIDFLHSIGLLRL